MKLINWKELEQRKDALVIDLRSRKKYEMWHYPGAVCLPFENFNDWYKEFMHLCEWLPKDMPIALYCERGNDSMLAARKLLKYNIEVYAVVGEKLRRID